jgi:hypothetical protein
VKFGGKETTLEAHAPMRGTSPKRKLYFVPSLHASTIWCSPFLLTICVPLPKRTTYTLHPDLLHEEKGCHLLPSKVHYSNVRTVLISPRTANVFHPLTVCREQFE